jgi:[acyl-carrier-protein] S-malonyltransferase
MDVILLFPGQGSQKPGMGHDLYDAYPVARDVFDTADRVLGFPLSKLCFEGPEAELTATQNAQPALLTHSAAAWAAARDLLAPHVRAAAGHSLGEFSAHYAAGALALADALRLVRRRAELMQEAGATQRGGMAAVLGLEPAVLDELCRSASAMNGVVVPANYNSPEQTVISGAVSAVERAMAMALEAGARRAIPLNVSGAFHSPLMESAAAGLAAALERAAFAPPRFPVYSNVSVTPASGAEETRSLLLRQLTAPVRWTEQMRALHDAWPDALWVEVGPGRVLTNLVRRILPVTDTTACGTAGDLEQLRGRLAG